MLVRIYNKTSQFIEISFTAEKYGKIKEGEKGEFRFLYFDW